MVGYWALLTFIPVPGAGADPYGEAANLARWVDEHFLPGKKLLGTLDPEGLLRQLASLRAGAEQRLEIERKAGR